MSAAAPTAEHALDLLAALVLPDGRRWGEAAHPFQWTDARAVLEPSSPTPYHFLTRARGAAKTGDLAAIAVAAMLEQASPGARLYAVAADQDQARLLLDSIRGYTARTPLLRDADALAIGAYRVAVPGADVVLEVLAADAPGAWGLRPWLVIVDELAIWPSTPTARQLWEAVTSAVAKLPDARMAVLTSAGDPAHWSARVLEHAKADPLWRVHEVPGPSPWMAEDRLAEQRRRLPESSFARLFLNRWTAAEDRLTSLDDLRACVNLEGPLAPQPDRRYAVGLDLGLTHDRTVAAVCHAEPMVRILKAESGPNPLLQESGLPLAATPGGRRSVVGTQIVLDRMQVWTGSRGQAVQLGDVEAWVAQAAASYRGHVVTDPWQAVGMAQRLRTGGVRVSEFTFSSALTGRLASTLHLLLRNRALALPDDPDLLDELANVRLREASPGVLRMSHDPGRHDDRAVALALAAQELLEAQARPLARIRS